MDAATVVTLVIYASAVMSAAAAAVFAIGWLRARRQATAANAQIERQRELITELRGQVAEGTKGIATVTPIHRNGR
jgi:hypothetical protein